MATRIEQITVLMTTQTQPATDFSTLAETARYLLIHVGSRDAITMEPVTLRSAMGLRKAQGAVTRVVSVDDAQVCHSPVRGYYIAASEGTIRPGTSDEVSAIIDATR